MEQIYFANQGREELGAELYRRVTNYYEEISRSGRQDLWNNSYNAYFAQDNSGRHVASRIERKGEQQEYSSLKVNHFRNFLINIHVIVTQQRPTYECRAINTDYKSKVQTILASNILEYYLREKRLEEHFRQATEICLYAGESYLELTWDKDSGDDFMPDPTTNKILKAGDIKARVYHPSEVTRSSVVDPDTKQDWYILRRFEVRHEVAARYPELADTILSAPNEETQALMSLTNVPRGEDWEDEYVPVYYFYHDRTTAVPEGRQAVFLSGGEVIEEGALAYSNLPVYKMMAYPQYNTPFGYTVAFDLLAIQDGIDMLNTIIMSNQATFGVGNIWMKPGSNVSVQQMGRGLNLIESAEKPESVNLTSTPAEVFNHLRGLETQGETISGVNSVARGQPEASLKSGSALALVASQAVQFSNGIAAAYSRLMEDVGTGIIRILQNRATVPRTAAIAGKANRSAIKSFVGNDLKDINRVIVDMGNPVSRTLSGRVQMAQDLLQSQLLKRPEQYLQVIQTGRIEPMLEDEMSEQLLITAENEELREGTNPPVISIDVHLQHIVGHRPVLADPASRRDPAVVQATLEHIQGHIDALRNTAPDLLNVLGQKSLPPESVPGPPQGGPPQSSPPQAGGPPPPGQQMPAPPNASTGVSANMPNMPDLPPNAPANLAPPQ